jgi:aminobenzoyl-glutamate utilization protein B
VQLLQSPETVRKAREEFDMRRGSGFQYLPLLERDTPPLDYRRATRD